jgi:hypothetical protein
MNNYDDHGAEGATMHTQEQWDNLFEAYNALVDESLKLAGRYKMVCDAVVLFDDMNKIDGGEVFVLFHKDEWAKIVEMCGGPA